MEPGQGAVVYAMYAEVPYGLQISNLANTGGNISGTRVIMSASITNGPPNAVKEIMANIGSSSIWGDDSVLCTAPNGNSTNEISLDDCGDYNGTVTVCSTKWADGTSGDFCLDAIDGTTLESNYIPDITVYNKGLVLAHQSYPHASYYAWSDLIAMNHDAEFHNDFDKYEILFLIPEKTVFYICGHGYLDHSGGEPPHFVFGDCFAPDNFYDPAYYITEAEVHTVIDQKRGLFYQYPQYNLVYMDTCYSATVMSAPVSWWAYSFPFTDVAYFGWERIMWLNNTTYIGYTRTFFDALVQGKTVREAWLVAYATYPGQPPNLLDHGYVYGDWKATLYQVYDPNHVNP